MDVDWSYRGTYMCERHGVSPAEADEALQDPDAVTLMPDPASKSGRGVRVIGRSSSSGRLLSIIILTSEGVTYGVNGWESNLTDHRRYLARGDAQ